jgi:hypothetical protein
MLQPITHVDFQCQAARGSWSPASCAAVAMPVEIVQFCWKYNVGRLQKLPEVGVKAMMHVCWHCWAAMAGRSQAW